MEQVLLQQHINLLILSNKYLSSNMRRILEYLILYIAIIIFLILFILHSIYITNSTNISVNCIMMYMKHINDNNNLPPPHNHHYYHNPTSKSSFSLSSSSKSSSSSSLQAIKYSYDIIKFRLVSHSNNDYSHHHHDYYDSITNYDKKSSNNSCYNYYSRMNSNDTSSDNRSCKNQYNNADNATSSNIYIDNTDNYYTSNTDTTTIDTAKTNNNIDNTTSTTNINSTSTTSTTNINSTSTTSTTNTEVDNIHKNNIYYFSMDRGILIINPILRQRHNYSMLTIDIDINDQCFGPPIPSYLIRNFIGKKKNEKMCC